MPDGICPFATQLPGADSRFNDARRQGVPFVVQHRTQGYNSVGLGQSRHHDTPGTFNFLTGLAGELWQFYPADVRCTHAAGGNNGCGVENEGFTGDPLPAPQLATLTRLVGWFYDEWGVPLAYETGDPRVWVDATGWSGHIAHRKIAYPPNPSYHHSDEVLMSDWAQIIAPPTQEIDMRILKGPDGAFWITDGVVKRYIGNPDEFAMWATVGVPVHEGIAQGVLDAIPTWTIGPVGMSVPLTLTGTIQGSVQ